METPEATEDTEQPNSSLEAAAQSISQGDAALTKDRAAWNEALEHFESARSALAALEPSDRQRHLLGWAQMGKANALVASDLRENIETSLAEYDAGLSAFESIEQRSPSNEADRAALLANKGQALARLGQAADIAAAETAYRAAVEIMEAQPWQDDPRLGLLLAANCMNLANAIASQAKLGEPSLEAVALLEKALKIAGEPDAEQPSAAVLIATIHGSIGRTLRWSSDTEQLDQALDAFQRGIAIMEKLPFQKDTRLGLELASAHANRSNLLGRATPTQETIQGALRSGEIALRLAQPIETANLLAAEISLDARRSICHAFGIIIGGQEPKVRQDLHDRASDLIEDGLKLARNWESRNANGLRHFTHHLFHLGCAFYCHQQPQFLGEFVEENLDLKNPDPTMRNSAAKIVAESIGRLEKADTVDPNSKELIASLQTLLTKLAA